VQLRFVTEVAPPQPFLCVNRTPIRYEFRDGAKAIRYRVNIASKSLLGISTSSSCIDGKEMYKKTWCTCRVVALPILTFCSFAALVGVAVVVILSSLKTCSVGRVLDCRERERGRVQWEMKVLPLPCIEQRPFRGSDDHVKWQSHLQ